MFAERFTFLKKRSTFTQKQIATLVGCSQQTIDHYEKGRARPSIDTLGLFADVFGVSTDYLLGRSDDPRSEEFSVDRREKRASLKAKETELLEKLPASLFPAYTEAKEKNPENLQQIIDTFSRMAKDYHSLTK